MTALHIVDAATVLDEALTDASPDLMRHLLQTMIKALLSPALTPWSVRSGASAAPTGPRTHGRPG